jgi:hypothetical protein
MLCQVEFLQPAAEILHCSEPIVFVLEASPEKRQNEVTGRECVFANESAKRFVLPESSETTRWESHGFGWSGQLDRTSRATEYFPVTAA